MESKTFTALSEAVFSVEMFLEVEAGTTLEAEKIAEDQLMHMTLAEVAEHFPEMKAINWHVFSVKAPGDE